jgi:murein DD-endopeptidase MepM/ murein hydrolase activator NlpD
MSIQLYKLIKWVALLIAVVLVAVVSFSVKSRDQSEQHLELSTSGTIQYVDFTIPYSFLLKAMKDDIASHLEGYSGHQLHWIEILAYLGAKSGGNFKKISNKNYSALITHLKDGKDIAELSKDMELYPYYYEVYSAILGQFLGNFAQEESGPDGTKIWKSHYGLRNFSPIAMNFSYVDSDDFGNGRNFGYKRKHLGHDMFASVGTPIIAIESGYIEELGWNRYGGWRIGIRSFDHKRYYYYAHMRKDKPFVPGLAIGKKVLAGDVIGYVGRTGYSSRKNVNGMAKSHLHIGLMLIFDESVTGSSSEIWIDLFAITRLLSNHRSRVVKDPATNEYTRMYGISG